MLLLVETISSVLEECFAGREPESYRNRALFKYLKQAPLCLTTYRNKLEQARNIASQLDLV